MTQPQIPVNTPFLALIFLKLCHRYWCIFSFMIKKKKKFLPKNCQHSVIFLSFTADFQINCIISITPIKSQRWGLTPSLLWSESKLPWWFHAGHVVSEVKVIAVCQGQIVRKWSTQIGQMSDGKQDQNHLRSICLFWEAMASSSANKIAYGVVEVMNTLNDLQKYCHPHPKNNYRVVLRCITCWCSSNILLCWILHCLILHCYMWVSSFIFCFIIFWPVLTFQASGQGFNSCLDSKAVVLMSPCKYVWFV